MIHAITIILICQLAGETTARALGLPVPGPVLGMGLLLAGLAVSPRLQALVVPTGEAILRHLTLLFVPAGVGIVGHLDRLGAEFLPLMLALVVSTALAIAVGALVFVAVARAIGSEDA